ncbi:MAG: hypothetical protein KF812_06540 [Fimbriimonadaceae bacterium]|nr:hypothetical protein [Fimbriimonadaceae bacterium]
MRLRLLNLFNWGIAGLYVYLAGSGAFGYSIWNQVLEIMTYDPVRLLQTGHTHALRLMVVLPAIWSSLQFGWDAEVVFGFYVGIAIVLAGYLSARAACLAATKSLENVRYFAAPVLLGLIAIATQMNGRIAFAFLGFAMIIGAQVGFDLGRIRSVWLLIFSCLAGLFFMSVSTGTFVIGVLSICRMAVIPAPIRWPMASKSRLTLLGVSIAVLAGLYSLISGAVYKNIEYFGGGLGGAVRMLKHGLGRFLPTDEPFLILFAVIGILLVYPAVVAITKRFQVEDPRAPIYTGLLFTAMGGLFGLSTLIVGLPLFLAVFAMWIWSPYLRPASNERSVAILT